MIIFQDESQVHRLVHRLWLQEDIWVGSQQATTARLSERAVAADGADLGSECR